MKKIFSYLLVLLYIFDLFCAPVLCSENEVRKALLEKYNLTKEQQDFLRYITAHDENIDTAEKIINAGLLEDCQKGLRNHFGSGIYASRLFLIAHSNPDNLSRKELKKTDKDFGNNYFIQIDDNFYHGVSEIDFGKVQSASKIYIYDRRYFKNIKTLKKYLEIQYKYSLNDKIMDCIMKDTNNLTRKMKTLQTALDDGLYEKYTKYCHNKGIAVYYDKFEERYEAVKKIESAKYLTDSQKKDVYKNRFNLIQADGMYYENLYKIDDFSNVKSIEFYGKNKYKNTKNIQKYKEFQKQYSLDGSTMDNVWVDTNRLKKYQKTVENAINDKTYFDYLKAKSQSNKNYTPYVKYGWIDTRFKENYKSYLYLKEHSTFEAKQIRSILRKRGEPEVAVNPFYWGDKEQKIKKTLKKQSLSDEEKYNQIIDRMEYRRPTTQEWIDDTATKAFIAVMFLSVIGTIGGIMALAGYSDAGGKFIKIVW